MTKISYKIPQFRVLTRGMGVCKMANSWNKAQEENGDMAKLICYYTTYQFDAMRILRSLGMDVDITSTPYVGILCGTLGDRDTADQLIKDAG